MKLNIPKPCSENWQDMSPAQQGRFCQLCEKEVIDFTEKTDAELLAFFRQNTGKVCGRVHSSQLKFYAESPKGNPFFPNLSIAASGILLASSLNILSASHPSTQQSEKIQLVDQSSASEEDEQNKQDSQESTSIIRGTVLDAATGSPLAGVMVYIENGSTPGVLTDEKGEYVLSGLQLAQQEIELVFYYRAVKQRTVLNLGQGLDVTVKPFHLITTETPILMGRMVMGDIVVKENLIQKTNRKVRRIFRR